MGQRVDIHIDKTDELGPALSKSAQDSVVWYSNDGDFTLIFNHSEGTPFKYERYLIRKGEPGVDSGEPIGVPGDYRYSVYDGIIQAPQNPDPTGSPKVRIKT